MFRELSGLPISCATPAANKVSADNRSLSIVCSAIRRSSVMSRKIMAYPTRSWRFAYASSPSLCKSSGET